MQIYESLKICQEIQNVWQEFFTITYDNIERTIRHTFSQKTRLKIKEEKTDNYLTSFFERQSTESQSKTVHRTQGNVRDCSNYRHKIDSRRKAEKGSAKEIFSFSIEPDLHSKQGDTEKAGSRPHACDNANQGIFCLTTKIFKKKTSLAMKMNWNDCKEMSR